MYGKMKKKNIKRNFKGMTALLLAVSIIVSGNTAAAAGSVNTSLPVRAVNVGSNIRIISKTDNVTYSSSDTTVASVTGDGVITGKKSGTVKITAKAGGKKPSVYQIKVSAKKGKPSVLPVAIGEVFQTNVKMKKGNEGKFTYSAQIMNKSKNGKIRKIIYYYSINTLDSDGGGNTATGDGILVSQPLVRQKTVKLVATNIAAGKKSKTVSCMGDYTGKASNMKPDRIVLYTGQARVTYQKSGNGYSFGWGTADKTAPEFSGLIKNKSSANGDYYRIYYSDMKDTYNYGQFVTAVDDRDGNVKITVDKSGINWKKSGVYKLQFKAVDKAGNVGKSWAYVQVIIPGTAEAIADKILGSVTRKNWSSDRKARAMYKYITSHSSYVQHTTHSNWRDAATRAFRYQSGDCYGYFAMAKLLLTRAGIPNIQIKRYPTPGGSRHFWNLTYVNGGWYHFDTTPRTRKGDFCLVTDGQLWGYSSGYTFRFQTNLYPARAKKRISPNP